MLVLKNCKKKIKKGNNHQKLGTIPLKMKPVNIKDQDGAVKKKKKIKKSKSQLLNK